MKIYFQLIGYSFCKFIGIIYFCINKILNISYKIIANYKNTVRYLSLKIFMYTLKKLQYMSLFKKYYAKYLIYYTMYNINCIYKQLKNPKVKNRAFSTGL